jgi:hypothetical protein
MWEDVPDVDESPVFDGGDHAILITANIKDGEVSDYIGVREIPGELLVRPIGPPGYAVPLHRRLARFRIVSANPVSAVLSVIFTKAALLPCTYR